MEDIAWQYPAEPVERAAVRFCEAVARWRGKPELETVCAHLPHLFFSVLTIHSPSIRSEVAKLRLNRSFIPIRLVLPLAPCIVLQTQGNLRLICTLFTPLRLLLPVLHRGGRGVGSTQTSAQPTAQLTARGTGKGRGLRKVIEAIRGPTKGLIWGEVIIESEGLSYCYRYILLSMYICVML